MLEWGGGVACSLAACRRIYVTRSLAGVSYDYVYDYDAICLLREGGI